MSPPPVTLTAQQITFLTNEMNAAGALATPIYRFDTFLATQVSLSTNVVAINGSKSMGEKIRTKKGWEQDDGEFRQAVADAIHETNKDWGPFD